VNPPIPTKSCSKNQNFKIKQEEQQQTRKKKYLPPSKASNFYRIGSSPAKPHHTHQSENNSKQKQNPG